MNIGVQQDRVHTSFHSEGSHYLKGKKRHNDCYTECQKLVAMQVFIGRQIFESGEVKGWGLAHLCLMYILAYGSHVLIRKSCYIVSPGHFEIVRVFFLVPKVSAFRGMNLPIET